MRTIITSFILYVALCSATYIPNNTDVSQYILEDDFSPENDRNAVLPQMRAMSPKATNSPQFLNHLSKDKDIKKRPKINSQPPIKENAAKGMKESMEIIQEIIKFKINSTDHTKARMKLGYLFLKMSSIASDTVLSFQKPSRRLNIIQNFLQVPNAACNATAGFLNTLFPNSTSNSSSSFNLSFNSSIGASNDNKGKLRNLQYYRMNDELDAYLNHLMDLEILLKRLIGRVMMKVIDIFVLVGEHLKMAIQNKKELSNAFMKIAKISKNASVKLFPGKNRKRGFIGNIVNNLIKTCQAKADLLSSLVPPLPTVSGNVNLNINNKN